MRYFLFILLLVFVLSSCHESLEKRAEREAADITKKNCPMQVMEGVVNDSIKYEKATRTIHYYYTLSGMLDTTAVDTKTVRTDMIETLKNNTGLKKYKDNGFNFAYTYFSTKNRGKVLIEVVVTPKNYN